MAHIATHPFGAELCEALGLDPATVRNLTIYAEAGDIPSVEVEVLVDTDTAERIVSVVRKYQLGDPWPAP